MASRDDIIVSCHHHMLRETTVGSGDYEGVSKNADGTYRSGRYHGPDGAPEGARLERPQGVVITQQRRFELLCCARQRSQIDELQLD